MNRKGFTLLELIVVLIVLAALVAIALPQYAGFAERARAAEAINAMGSIKTGEEAFWIAQTTAAYTSNLADLGVTLATTNWTYAIVPTAGTSFAATATRTSGTNANNTVVFTYTHATGVSSWGGTHPGAPH